MEEPRRRSQDLLARARARFEAAWAREQRRRPPGRRDPGAAGEPAPVEPPRNPTLAGGAAAELDA